MECGETATKDEEVDVGMGIIELWCWCAKCKVETFHPIPYDKENYPNNKPSKL